MILGFKTHWPDGRQTYFPHKILAGLEPTPNISRIPKIHSFRIGNRWKEGMSIQFATGVRTKQYNQFWHGRCQGVQNALIGMHINGCVWIILMDEYGNAIKDFSIKEILLFAANDGFDSMEELREWFFPMGYQKSKVLSGQIVHWTDFKY